MGHRILSHILNIKDEEALKLISNSYELDPERNRYLDGFISICRRQRLEYFDEDTNTIDHSLFYAFPQMVVNNRHAFNIWREELGGKNFNTASKDPLIISATNLALEIYPLFLIKASTKDEFFTDTFTYLNMLLYKLDEERKKLCAEILKDASISKLFTHKGENENDTWGNYVSSSGRGGQNQLCTFPSSIINNAFELLRFKGLISQEKLAESIEEVINMIRQVAEGKTINLPVLIGFNNVGLIDEESFEIKSGTIKPYTEEIIEIIPKELKPTMSTADNRYLGFILESTYEYKAEFEQINNEIKFPKQLKETQKKLEIINENICITFALAIHRDEPIGIKHAWTLSFDPLSQGGVFALNFGARTLQRHYLVHSNDQKSIKYWASIISENNDKSIRTAIRRVLIAINERANPGEGFLDVVIAWDSIFGSYGETAFKISISIAKLLRNSQNERADLQKEIAEYFQLRNKTVHGGENREIDTKTKNRCIEITLDVLRNLHEENQELLFWDAKDRSKALALK